VAEFLPGKCKAQNSNSIFTKKARKFIPVFFNVNIYYYLCRKIVVLETLKLQKYIWKKIKNAHDPISRNND
jgi:hypothetical protein